MWKLSRIVLLSCLAAATVATAAPAVADDAIPDPRALTAAEEAAAQLAVDYLSAGPEAWLDRLDPAGALGRLDRDAALAEIGVRAGPPGGARWQLQTPGPGQPEERAFFTLAFPSGGEETLVMDLVLGADGEWRLHRLRCLAEPWVERPLELGAGSAPSGAGFGGPGEPERTRHAGASAQGPPRPGPEGGSPALPALPELLALLAFLATLALVLGAAPRIRRPALPLATPTAHACLALAVVLAGGGLLVACGDGDDPPEAAVAATPEDGLPRLGELWPLRQALAEGEDRASLDRRFATVPAEGPLRLAADLWRAELALQQSGLEEAQEVLSALPQPSPVPLGALLRARLAFIRTQPLEAAEAYDEVLTAGPDHDGIRQEAALAQILLGRSDEGEIGMILLAEMGSRLADAWYDRAQVAVLRDRPEEGEEYLRRAWQLQPMERKDLLSSPLLAMVVARAPIFPLFQMDSPAEPRVAPDLTHRRALDLPPEASAWLTGRLLRVELAEGRLTVPGGAVLAPDDAVVLAADGLRRREEEEALRNLPRLTAEIHDLDSLAHPRRREEVLRTAHALFRQSRWQDLVDLTRSVDGSRLDPVPGELVQLRAAALTRLERRDEARTLLIRLAKSDLANQRRDPANFYLLADLAAENGEYDVALKLLRRAATLSPHGRNEARIRQITMEQRLMSDHAVWETRHFRIVYPRVTGDKYARQLAIVLEEERKRISRWIPPVDGPLIEVQLYPLAEFLRAYSGSALVLGIYDGVVRVPFADLRSLHPELVSILSHELAHALIDRRTEENAPKWFHEGLAEHIQMTQDWANPIPDLHAAGHTIAFPVLEPILQGFAEAQLIEIAYGQSAWAIHYVEASHGIRALHRLMDAFRAGADTEEALQRVFGMTVADFHQAAWQWCLEDAPMAWPTQVRRYDHEYDLPFERSRPRTEGRRVDTVAGRGGAQRGGPDRGSAGRDRESTPPGNADRGRPALAPDEMARAMGAWHRTYTREVAAFKQTLGPVMDDLSRGRIAAHHGLCTEMARDLDRLLAHRGALASPSPAVAHPLRNAFTRFRDMARACQVGQTLESRTAYRQAERHLADAARELGRYGLAP